MSKDEPTPPEGEAVTEPDGLYGDVCKLAESNGHVTPSLLQRSFRIPYSRALMLIEQMEREKKIERIEVEKFNSFKWQWVNPNPAAPVVSTAAPEPPKCTCLKEGSGKCKYPHPCRICYSYHPGVSCYWHNQGKTPADKRSDGRTFKLSDGRMGCDECCNGDRCDDPTHRSRENCPYCLGSNIIPEPAPVAPESYKPAEGPEFCGCVCHTVGLFGLMCCPCTKRDLDELVNGKRRDPVRVAATPVTMEAPNVEEIARRIAICEKNGTKWAPFKVAEIKHLLATPKPIGDVEAVARKIAKLVSNWAGKKNIPITSKEGAELFELAVFDTLSPFFAPAPPCSECATPSEINLPWTVSGDSPSKPPMVWDASGDSIVNQMPDGTPYFEPEVAAFIGKAANSLAAHELECATLRKERDDSEKAIAKALRFTPSEEEPEECAPWMVEAEPEPMGPFSLIEAITAMMEMFDREFSKADKRAEAAEAQLSTLRDATLEEVCQIVCDRCRIDGKPDDMIGHSTATPAGDDGGPRFVHHYEDGGSMDCAAEEIRELMAKAALAPTPEVAPKK